MWSTASKTREARSAGSHRGRQPARAMNQELKTIMRENIRPASRDVPLIQLGLNQCRFPVSEDRSVPGGYRFCAGPTSPDRVYCDHHHTVVTAVDPRRARPGLHFPQRRAA
ncbi:GcrA family cell cycle regulator [Mesorhizobium sp. M0514]|uniref:GcrA family cell cycle regulator n=2 Tax=Mesorhizobium TaxID=68287 RepID=UPI003339DC77